MSKHAQGGKINRSHTTIIDAAERVVRVAERLPEVSKISLGVVTPKLPPGRHRIKCAPITGGLRVTVRGTASKQELFIYTSAPLKTTKALEALFA